MSVLLKISWKTLASERVVWSQVERREFRGQRREKVEQEESARFNASKTPL